MSLITIQIVCTNDTHSQFEPFEKKLGLSINQTTSNLGGVARRKTIFKQLTQDVPGTLILDVGDHFTGSDFFTFFQGELEMKILKQLNYHASALGNHDFDGVLGESKGLHRFLHTSSTHCPKTQMLCSNILDGTTFQPILKPYIILEPVLNVRVGVTAVMGEHAWKVSLSLSLVR